MDLGLADKVVVVTGGTKGIGFQVSKDFLAEGAKVIVMSRNEPQGTAFQELKKKYTSSLHYILTDVTDQKALQNGYTEAVNKWDRIDIVIANVGNGTSTKDPVPDFTQWNKVWDLNFNSAVNTARTFSPELIRSQGSLLFISSIAGIESIGAPTDYSTAKSAVISFAKTLSHKLAPDVRVNVIAPGNVLTEEGTWKNKLQQDPDAVDNMLNTRVPMKRFGYPQEISSAVLFLSSEKASFITGACLVVDGGQTISFH